MRTRDGRWGASVGSGAPTVDRTSSARHGRASARHGAGPTTDPGGGADPGPVDRGRVRVVVAVALAAAVAGDEPGDAGRFVLALLDPTDTAWGPPTRALLGDDLAPTRATVLAALGTPVVGTAGPGPAVLAAFDTLVDAFDAATGAYADGRDAVVDDAIDAVRHLGPDSPAADLLDAVSAALTRASLAVDAHTVAAGYADDAANTYGDAAEDVLVALDRFTIPRNVPHA